MEEPVSMLMRLREQVLFSRWRLKAI